MIVFPAIDIKDGRCVRLKQGEFDDLTVYSEDVIQVAYNWEKKGAKYIHIVDLDGAEAGISKNLEVITSIVKKVKTPVQVGGGIRSYEAAENLLSNGVQRIILGTTAIKNKELIKKLVNKYDDRVVVSIDAKDGKVAIDGWINKTDVTAYSLVADMEEMGVRTIVYTDISKDGMMQGPNFREYSTLLEKFNIDIIASGGVSTLEDVERLRAMDVYGCIIGKALYCGAIKLEDVTRC